MIDSKDAKCIINGELPPVLKPGKTWKSIEYPDHTFDRSRNNAVTPITQLFLQSKILPFNTPALNSANLNIPGTQTEVQVTRTGKAVTLINLSLYEEAFKSYEISLKCLTMTKFSKNRFF